jgi:hypothetical protein
MNRLIKFRIWNNKTSEWVHGPGKEVNLFGEMILLGGFMKNIPLTDWDDCVILQFTGLKDSTGVEIYEGDICDAGMVIGPIEFIIGSFSLGSNPLIEFLPSNICVFSPEFDPSWIDVKVIGNIFENKELI